MSTPLIAVASILAFFAVILIPLMMIKPARKEKLDQPHEHSTHGKRAKRKKKK